MDIRSLVPLEAEELLARDRQFGKHRYSVGEQAENARKRKLFRRYQQYFQCPDEV